MYWFDENAVFLLVLYLSDFVKIMNIPKPYPIIIVTSPDNGQVDGVSTFCRCLSEGLANSGIFDVFVVTPSSAVEALTSVPCRYSANLHHFRCPTATGGAGVGQYIEAISSGRRCVVLLNYWPSIFNIRSIRTYMPNASVVQIVHDLPWLSVFEGNSDGFLKSYSTDFQGFSEAEKKFLKYTTYDTLVSFMSSDSIVCLCNDTMDIINRNYQIPVDKIHLIPNGLPDKYETLTGCKCPSDRNTRVLFVGRPSVSKGWDRVIDLAYYFKKEKIDAVIICAGFNGVADIVPNDVSLYFIEAGIVSQQKLYELYRQVDYIFIPSRHEQCSYVGIEAMMHGMEIVAFESFGLSNMLDNKCAHIIDKVEQFPLQSSEKGSLARERFQNIFSEGSMIESYSRLLSNLFLS